MKVNTHSQSTRLFSISLTAVLALIFVGIAGAQERTRKVQQGIVGGTVISAEAQENMDW